jgi:hypothetical protein
MFITVLLLTTILIGISVLGLAIKMLVIENGKFPVTSIGGNIHLKKRGISCPKHEELRYHRNLKKGNPCDSCGFNV